MSASRKDDHIRFAVQQRQSPRENAFDQVRFLHRALSGLNRAAVDPSVTIAGATWDFPFFLNGMTGGSERGGEINRQLAIAARQTGLAMATGSMSSWFKEPSQAATYQVVRQEHPQGFVMANVSPEATDQQALAAVELLGADALQIHLNSAQETVMPEGDRFFGHWPERIADLLQVVPVPVIVKEVGFGISRETVRELLGLGVSIVDVSGSGGTDFARIENERRTGSDMSYLSGWGQSTPACLLDTGPIAAKAEMTLLASGGVRHPLDVVRALSLGASAVGVSGVFLEVLVEHGVEELVRTIRSWQEEIVALMALLGASSVADLAKCPVLITGSLEEFCRLRNIDAAGYANRFTPRVRHNG